MTRTPAALLVVALAIILAAADRLPAQSFQWGGAEFNAVRKISIPAGQKFPVVVIQFFHHGEILPGGENVVVVGQNRKLMPIRVLQIGPGDYCRLAFQTEGSQESYEVYYGGNPPLPHMTPKWTSTVGLLLETRQYKQCNLNSFESVRDAFEQARPIGAGYVAAVQHSHNPFALNPAPFLSRYTGYLQIESAGLYGFLTSSQDCSFLLIDGKEVVSSPGRITNPARRALRGSRKDIRLTASSHKFEYYHAASGPQAQMVAAWEVSPSDPKPKPKSIPSELFRTKSIGRLETGPVKMRAGGIVPDFVFAIRGDVPLPDNDLALIGVDFADRTSKALTQSGKLAWDFGDGQTSEMPNPMHVFLHSGVYPVKLTVRRAGQAFEITNRVYIDRPTLTRSDEKTFHKLDDHLKVIETYNPSTLDAVALGQLVSAYQWKAELILSEPLDTKKPEEEKKVDEKRKGGKKGAKPDPEPKPDKPPSPEEIEAAKKARKQAAMEYISRAVEAGKVAFLAESAASGDEDLAKLARIVAPMARDQLGDSLLAGNIWRAASLRITRKDLKAECEMQAADVAVNDIVNVQAAKSFLELAASHLGQSAKGPSAATLSRVWGDYYALTGDGEAARKAYRQSESIFASKRSYVERTAWQGAHSRSTEEFLNTGELDRAAAQIRSWEAEFPADKIDGYLTLLYAQYWARRGMHQQAISQAEQLLAVNPDSPYVDQLLLLAATSAIAREDSAGADAFLHSLLNDYPGSPLVPDARKMLESLDKRKQSP